MSSQTTYPFVPKACHCKLSEKLSTHPDTWWGYEMTKQKRFGRRSRYHCHSAQPTNRIEIISFTRPYDLLWALILDFSFNFFFFLISFFLWPTVLWSILFGNISCPIFAKIFFILLSSPSNNVIISLLRSTAFLFIPSPIPCPPAISVPKLCEGTPPISYASLWNQERLKIRGLGSPPNPVIQQNNAFQCQAWVSEAWVSLLCQLFLMDGFPQKRRTLAICLWPPLISQPPFYEPGL